mgnify:CR=1 FL=1
MPELAEQKVEESGLKEGGTNLEETNGMPQHGGEGGDGAKQKQRRVSRRRFLPIVRQ